LIRLALVRSPREFRRTPVCGSLIQVPCRDTEPNPDLVHQGLSEKVALVVSFISTFITGFVLAFARNWRLALAMSSILPCISLTGALMNKFISKYMQCVRSRSLLVFCRGFIVTNPGYHSSMLPKEVPSQKRSYLQSVLRMPSGPRKCSRPCMTFPHIRPTQWSAECLSPAASASPFPFLSSMLPTASVSLSLCPPTRH